MPLRQVEHANGARMPEPAAAAAAVPPAAAAGGKYVPRFRRDKPEGSGAAPPPEPDRWGRSDDRPSQPGDRWRGEDRRQPSLSGAATGSKTTWSSSRRNGF